MPLLSHYTNRSGLEGIAQSKMLWATSFMHLNDTSELFYAWQRLQKGAMELFLRNMPSDLITLPVDIEAGALASTQQFKELVKTTEGKGHMYVFSFARATTEDHENRGIFTLWDRYTKHEGYCVQFAEEDVRKMMDLESWKASYAFFSLLYRTYNMAST